jgi:hypothetical protein
MAKSKIQFVNVLSSSQKGHSIQTKNKREKISSINPLLLDILNQSHEEKA